MKRRIIALTTIAALQLSALSRPAEAQAQLAVPAAAACIQSGVCIVVVVLGAGWYIIQNQQSGKEFQVYAPSGFQIHSEPMPQPGPRPEFNHGENNQRSNTTEEFGRLSKNRDGCKEMEGRMRRGGFKLRLVRMERNDAPGTFYEIWCVFLGDSREVQRFRQHGW